MTGSSLSKACVALMLWLGLAGPIHAEATSVKVATQIGLSYLPLIIMEHDKLWEQKAKEKGLSLQVEYTQLGGSAPLNDALLSDSVQIASAGLAPMLTLWDRTARSYRVKGLSAVNASPMDLLTNRPSIKSLKDFTPADRIALPSIRVSLQAIIVAMAVEKAFGPGNWAALDNIQVAMAHPEAYATLTTRAGDISGYMSSSPFQERALQQSGISKVTDSYEVLGGPSTLSVTYAKTDFVEKNPKLTEAFMEAQRAAVDIIKTNLPGAIDKYFAVTKDKTSRETVEAILKSKDCDFDIFPKATMPVADFMARAGIMKGKPASWKDYFFDTIKNEPGS
jgi:NitT/TauT family transport system substrate-binding protein